MPQNSDVQVILAGGCGGTQKIWMRYATWQKRKAAGIEEEQVERGGQTAATAKPTPVRGGRRFIKSVGDAVTSRKKVIVDEEVRTRRP